MSNLTKSHVLAGVKAEKGYEESPAGSNRTKYGVWYGMNGVPWCAEFVSWNFREDLTAIWGKFARTDAKAAALNKAGKLVKGRAGLRRGDIVFFAFNGAGYQGRYLGIHHVGFYMGKLDDGRFVTIEGNTSVSSNDNGGKVMVRYRAPSGVVAYFRPNYAPEIVAPKPVPVPTPTYPTLEYGDNGAWVERLQAELNQSGANLVKDGDFGPKTLAAVKAFQIKHGMSGSGKVGEKTWAALIAEKASKNKTGTVTARHGLRVRRRPGTSYAVLGVLSYGTKVTIVSSASGWDKIKYKDGYGYVDSSYVR